MTLNTLDTLCKRLRVSIGELFGDTPCPDTPSC
ncbi:hypothetical protein [Candidatus Entotheonella palauensis]